MHTNGKVAYFRLTFQAFGFCVAFQTMPMEYALGLNKMKSERKQERDANSNTFHLNPKFS